MEKIAAVQVWMCAPLETIVQHPLTKQPELHKETKM